MSSLIGIKDVIVGLNHMQEVLDSGDAYLNIETIVNVINKITYIQTNGETNADLMYRSHQLLKRAADELVKSAKFGIGFFSTEMEIAATEIAPPAPSVEQCSDVSLVDVPSHKRAIKILEGFASQMSREDAAQSLGCDVDNFHPHAMKILVYPCGLYIEWLSTGVYYTTMIQDEIEDEALMVVEMWLAARAHWC
jgi:hypothetical protein